MPYQNFTVQKASTSVELYLNGTNGDMDYNFSDIANFTAQLSIAGLGVEIWTNLTGNMELWQSGSSPLQNLTLLNYSPGTYLIKANFSGNENYSASEINHTLTIIDLIKPQYSNIAQSPIGNPTYGQAVQANSTWTDNVNLSVVYFRSNYLGAWQNYTALSSGSEYCCSLPADIAQEQQFRRTLGFLTSNNKLTMPVRSFTVQKHPLRLMFT
jgi:hypothetical protein